MARKRRHLYRECFDAWTSPYYNTPSLLGVPVVQPAKVHSLIGRIDMPRMHCAFKAVKRNRGAAGVDKVDIRAFEANLEQNWLL